MNTTTGICSPVFNSHAAGDRQDNDSFEAIFEAMNRFSRDVLPGDFVMAILLALPVKSLLRFKSVCWSWHDLILSRRFINIHHDQAKRSSSLICFYKFDGIRTSYTSVSVSEDGIVTDLSLPPTLLNRGLRILHATASCRGMVCFTSGSCFNSVVVWNIATREFRIFHGMVQRAHPITTCNRHHMIRGLALGFTFIPITNEYKLVRVIIYSNNTVFIKITRWRNSMILLPAKEMVMDFPYNITQLWRCPSTNQAIYWLGHKIKGGPSIVIAFDLIEDKFREISTPYNYDEQTGHNDSFFHRKLELLSENKLAIFRALFTDTGYLSCTVWALNDYGGATECWVKQYTFQTRHDLRPMGLWFNGGVIVPRMDRSEVEMGLYDWHTDQMKDFPVEIKNELFFSSFCYYKESLVPLPHTINNVCPNERCPFQTSDPSIISRQIISDLDDNLF